MRVHKHVPGRIAAASRKTLLIAVFILFVLFTVDSPVRAQEDLADESRAGLGADNALYGFDQLAERTWQGILGIFPAPTRLRYYRQRLDERLAEAAVVARIRGVVSDEALAAIVRARELHREAFILINADSRDKELDVFIRDLDAFTGTDAPMWRFEGEYGRRIVEEKQKLADRREELRMQAIDAVKKLGQLPTDLAQNLKQAQQDHEVFLRREAQFRLAAEITAERTENLFEGERKAALVLTRPEPASPRAAELWDRLVARLGAPKPFTVERLMEMMKKAQGGVAETDKLARETQRAVRSDRVAGERRTVAEETERDRVAVKPPEPEPVPAPQPKAAPKAAPKPAVKPAPKAAPKPAPQAPAAAPAPEFTPIPSDTVAQKPVTISYYQNLFGQVGVPFNAQYSATDGLPPYHFQLETGVGFPPFGLVLDTNGLLSGTPKVAQTATIGVCVVDTAGDSICGRTFIQILAAAPVAQPQPAPNWQPEPEPQAEPAVALNFAITSATCQHVGGSGYDMEYRVLVNGTATGPADARLVMPGLPGYLTENWNSAWGDRTSKVVDRGAGDVETTNWTADLVIGGGASKTVTVDGYVRKGTERVPDSRTLTCQAS